MLLVTDNDDDDLTNARHEQSNSQTVTKLMQPTAC